MITFGTFSGESYLTSSDGGIMAIKSCGHLCWWVILNGCCQCAAPKRVASHGFCHICMARRSTT